MRNTRNSIKINDSLELEAIYYKTGEVPFVFSFSVLYTSEEYKKMNELIQNDDLIFKIRSSCSYLKEPYGFPRQYLEEYYSGCESRDPIIELNEQEIKVTYYVKYKERKIL